MDINDLKIITINNKEKLIKKEFKNTLKLCLKSIKKAKKYGVNHAYLSKRYFFRNNKISGWGDYGLSNECIDKIIHYFKNLGFKIEDCRKDELYKVMNCYIKIIW